MWYTIDIMQEIRNYIQNYYQPVKMPGGYTHDIVDTLKFNYLYYNGRYSTGSYDAQGYYKFFFNIVKPTCDIATKFVDLDTKDVLLLPEGGSDSNAMYTWLMERDLRTWMKEQNVAHKRFAHTLNVLAEQFPKGHVILKKVDGGFKKVPIVSMRVDPSAESMEKSPYVAELHMMTEFEMKANGWDVEKMQSRFSKGGIYDIYEVYMRQGKTWKRQILGGLYDIMDTGVMNRTPESKINEGTDYVPPILLAEDTVARLPYRELRWEEVEGRWLGFGFPEYLKDNQISENEAENLEKKALILKALQMYQTADETVEGKNVLTDSMNGDILVTNDQILPIAKDNADLSAYNNTRDRNGGNIERKTFTSDITTGASLPSRTPLGVASLQASLATSFFELKRENMALFVKDLLWDDVIPEFKKTKRKEHTMTFLRSDDDRKKMEEIVLDLKKWEIRKRHIDKTGFDASMVDIENAWAKASDELKNKESLEAGIPARAYDDAKYRLDITMTGENVDVGARSQVLQIALQTVAGNPAILQDEGTRAIFFKFLSLGGVNANEFNLLQSSQPQQQPLPQGGSMSAPQPGQLETSQSAIPV